MKMLLKPLLVALCLLALPMAMPASAAQRNTAKAYAPEDLRQLSYNDQVRVIGQEYLEQSGGRRIPDDQLRFYLDQVGRSDWTFSRIKQDIAQSLAGSDGGYDPGNGSNIRCESTDSRRRTCRTPWQSRSRVTRQLSETRCIEGRNWSSNYGEVTVWSGCRAEFGSDGDMDGPVAGGQIRCESTDNRQRTCRTPWQGRSRVARQLSDTRCIEGRNWSSQYNEVSVWGGCRADFTSDYNTDPGNGQGAIRCESTRSSPRTCNTPWSGDSRLVRQLSESRCTEGETWSSRPGTVYVSRGCRGEFASGGNNGGGWGTGNRTVTCSSLNGRYTTCHWPPGQGQPRLQRQLSSEACVRGRSWGMANNNTIWVSQGCRAVFSN